MDIEAVKQGLQAARVEPATDVVDADADTVDVVDDSTDNDVDTVSVDNEEDTTNASFETEQGLINYFSEQLGFTGTVEGEGVDALLHIARQRLDESERIANDERVQQFLRHVEQGGTIDTYEQIQPTNYYGNIQLDEANTDFTEKLVRECLIVLKNFDDEKEITDYITDLKDKGTLFEYAEKNLVKLQKYEQRENEQRKATIEKQLETERNEAVKYYKELGSVFDKGLVSGVVVDKKHLDTIKQLSLPNEQNKLGINDILDDMPTEHVATMNTLAWCLKNKQPFEYKPNAVRQSPSNKPIHDLLQKGKGAATEKRTLETVIKSKFNK